MMEKCCFFCRYYSIWYFVSFLGFKEKKKKNRFEFTGNEKKKIVSLSRFLENLCFLFQRLKKWKKFFPFALSVCILLEAFSVCIISIFVFFLWMGGKEKKSLFEKLIKSINLLFFFVWGIGWSYQQWRGESTWERVEETGRVFLAKGQIPLPFAHQRKILTKNLKVTVTTLEEAFTPPVLFSRGVPHVFAASWKSVGTHPWKK